DEQLLVVAGRTAAIGLALEHEQWRPDARDIAQRRLPPQLEHPLVGERVAEQGRAVVLDPGIRIRPARHLIGDTVFGYRGPESVARADQPVDHETAVRQPQHAESI